MLSYTLTVPAKADLLEILAYIAVDNVDAALSMYDRFYGCFEMLAVSPAAGRRREELEAGLRSFPLGSYVVFYRARLETIEVIRVLHGSRDIDALFNAE
jgi:toxin ParE1/3/4